MMMDQRLAKESVLGVVVLLAMTLIAYFAGIDPVQRAREKSRQQHATLMQLRASVDKAERELVGLRETLASTKAAATGSIALVSARMLSQRLTEIPALAEREGVKLAEIQPGGPVAMEKCQRVPIRFSGEGTYAGIVRFLDTLRAELPDVEVTSLSLFAQPGQKTGSARFSADVAWFTLPESAAKPARPVRGAAAAENATRGP